MISASGQGEPTGSRIDPMNQGGLAQRQPAPSSLLSMSGVEAK